MVARILGALRLPEILGIILLVVETAAHLVVDLPLLTLVDHIHPGDLALVRPVAQQNALLLAETLVLRHLLGVQRVLPLRHEVAVRGHHRPLGVSVPLLQ